jgi:hypothetical protein
MHMPSALAIYSPNLSLSLSLSLSLFACPNRAFCALPLPLEVRTRGEKRHALIHDRLAHPQVIVNPLLDAGCLGELVWLHTGAVSGGVVLALFLIGRLSGLRGVGG